MKDLYSIIIESKFNKEANKEYLYNEGLQMINEAFKASILSKLAKKIATAEQAYNKSQKEYEQRTGRKQSMRNFASIFAPIDTDVTDKAGRAYRSTRAIKWSEITDDDFKVFDSLNKELTKMIKTTYGRKDAYALYVFATDNDVLNIVRAYGHGGVNDGCYYFQIGSDYADGVKQIMKDHYSYQKRPLKVNEVLEVAKNLMEGIEGVKCYALQITSDMLTEYNTLVIDRKEAQKGAINFDKESLAELLKNQKAKYAALVKKMKADKAKGNLDAYLDKIKEINQEVVALAEKAMKTPAYLSEYSSLGYIMQTVASLYETLYTFAHYSKASDDRLQKAKQKAADNGEDFDEEKFSKWDFARSDAEHAIKKLDDTIKDIKDDVQKLKDRLEGKY